MTDNSDVPMTREERVRLNQLKLLASHHSAMIVNDVGRSIPESLLVAHILITALLSTAVHYSKYETYEEKKKFLVDAVEDIRDAVLADLEKNPYGHRK